MGLSVLLILAVMVLSVPISADYPWMDTIGRESTVNKPVDPIHINDQNYTVKIDVEEEWVLKYNLQKGKTYHIFLVGDWVMNESNPITDYDISVQGPGITGERWFTESAGLLEQVWNEDGYPYFVPEASGKFEFNILNDPRDSEGIQSAYFMIIERIDVNEWYSVDLEGRNDDQEEVLQSGWGYEFNTSSPQIRIRVQVPKNSPLDMYEARLYAMASPDNEIGYSLNGVGIPFGEYFNVFSGDWGGYNTSCKGNRNILAFDSAEASGESMEFLYNAPSGIAGDNVFYYLALIAEHEEDTVDFIIQTDFSPPELTLVDPPELGIEDDDTEITVTIEDEADIDKVWIDYTTDGENWIREDLSSGVDGYWVILENYYAGDLVEYIVYAEDVFDNVGSTGSSFKVKKIASIYCSIADMTLMGDQKAEISGDTTLVSSPLHVNFTNGDIVINMDLETEVDGSFNLNFKPPALGDWSFQAHYFGDTLSLPAGSNIITFQASSLRTQITGSLSDIIVKKNKPLTISGSVDPIVTGMKVDVTLVSATESVSEKVPVASDGTYSFTFSPPETGIWNTLTRYGDGFTYKSSQSLLEFEVIPLTIFDKIIDIYLMMIRPPFIYGAIGAVGLTISSVAYMKRESIINALPGKLGKSMKKGSKKKNKKNGKKSDRFRRTQ
jgi:hypothetical protein